MRFRAVLATFGIHLILTSCGTTDLGTTQLNTVSTWVYTQVDAVSAAVGSDSEKDYFLYSAKVYCHSNGSATVRVYLNDNDAVSEVDYQKQFTLGAVPGSATFELGDTQIRLSVDKCEDAPTLFTNLDPNGEFTENDTAFVLTEE